MPLFFTLPFIVNLIKPFPMETTFHFSSADEIPEWQKQETLKRQNLIQNHRESLLDFDEMMADLEKELVRSA